MSKAPMLRALDHDPPAGPVPIWELSFQLWDHFSGDHLIIGQELADLTGTERTNALARDAEIIADVAELLHFGAITLPATYWEVAPGIPTYYWMRWEDILQLADRLQRVLPSGVILVGSASAVMAIPDSHDYVNFCYRLFDEPEKVDEAADRLYRAGIGGAKRLRDAGVPVIKTSSDLADNAGLFFNPDQLERFIYPYLDRWVEECNRLGLRTILHSDGDLTEILPRIVESGVNAIQAIDPTAGMDLAATKAVAGNQLCLCGNVDCGVLLSGRPEDVEDLAEETLQIGMPGGSFAFGASNAIVPETPPENYRAMIRAWERLGRY